MINFKRIKNIVSPLNAVITAIISLFICIRVLSNNHENAFIIETINPTETQTVIQTQAEKKTENETAEISEADTQTQIETKTTSEIQVSDLPDPIDEPVAYSAELDKTFTLDVFNTLSKDELMTFSGIGEVTAKAILDYRKENGPFNDFDDLMLVKGIGEKKLQKIMTILP